MIKLKKIFSVVIISMMIISMHVGDVFAYSSSSAVNYAHNWAKGYNSNYKSFDGGDCTNYVSQCVVAGGKNMKSKELAYGDDCTNNLSYWFNHKQKCNRKGDYIYKWKWSSSFNNVGDFYSYWKKQGATCSSGMSLDSIQKELKLGDIVQIYDTNSNHRCFYHSIIITAGKKGDWKYSGHTSPRKDYPLEKITGPGLKLRYIRIK